VNVEKLTFTVDSKLLRELGERLVGRPHIALAELVKNSYDADASQVVIRFISDRIEVSDDGHGMSREDFEDKWLRIGSTHKEREAFSPRLRRPLTGSKGVGRLAVQLIANKLEVRSVERFSRFTELKADVDWREAVESGDLTEAPVYVDSIAPENEFPRDSETGTRLILSDLNHRWGRREFEELANELWPLQSPFEDDEARQAFRVTLESPYAAFVRAFDSQMTAVLGLWTARLVGELLPEDFGTPSGIVDVVRTYGSRSGNGNDESWDTASDFSMESEEFDAPARIVRLTLEVHEGQTETVYYRLRNCHLDSLKFEIRVFQLQHRQPRGISVSEARRYLRRFGGVHVYDTGFHLPYYGPDTDWLHIEIDHSHRLSRSQLLPRDLQKSGGMSNLPTNSRLFGTVHVNTAHEQRIAQEGSGTTAQALAIQVSRDRLTETAAYRDLVTLVRFALDYYAMAATRREAEKSKRDRTRGEKPSKRMQRLQETLDDIREDLSEGAFEELSNELDQALRETEAEERRYESYLGLLGALATAGISALAYEHEVSKQFEALESIVTSLRDAANGTAQGIDLEAIADQLEAWLDRARATHNLFSPLLAEENRTLRGRFPARATLELIRDQVEVINPGVKINVGAVPEQMLLPPGRYAEWSAIFQNIFLNAFNAMRETEHKKIDVTAGRDRSAAWLLIQDTGVGVDLAEAEELFEPFVRRLQLSADYAALGLGGGGLGLTIVRMMAQELDCSVRFVPPDAAHATAIQIAWET
jgi:signal transduction histidine kinase